jgi:hypothetical protein
MTNVKFNYNLKKDAWSWVLVTKDKNLWGLNWRDQIAHIPDELLEKIEKANFSRAQKIVEKHIKDGYNKKYKNRIMYSEMQVLEKSWRIVEKKYFTTLAKITNQPIFTKEFTCYFTTGLMCPYNEKENWFMVSMWHSIPSSITIICHEIMHLQFLHYYKKYLQKNGLSNDQIENLKESLTFLLNEPEFNKIILCDDTGYPEHQKLRKKLKNIWLENKDFKSLIDKAISIIKK